MGNWFSKTKHNEKVERLEEQIALLQRHMHRLIYIQYMLVKKVDRLENRIFNLPRRISSHNDVLAIYQSDPFDRS
nr:MAG: RNA-dependent RNA polymerase [Bat faecal associated arli-like virus 1]